MRRCFSFFGGAGPNTEPQEVFGCLGVTQNDPKLFGDGFRGLSLGQIGRCHRRRIKAECVAVSPSVSQDSIWNKWMCACMDSICKDLLHTVDGSKIRRTPVEVGNLSHYFQGFILLYIPGGCLGFLPSRVSLAHEVVGPLGGVMSGISEAMQASLSDPEWAVL